MSKATQRLFADTGLVRPVAFCDVDFRNKKTPKEFMAGYPDAPRFADFRVMFDKMGDDIDAVNIASPGHWHYVMAIEAMRRGKHVFLEKRVNVILAVVVV